MKIKENIPGFVDGASPRQADFNTKEELLELDFVKSWSRGKGFHRFSLTDYGAGFKLLMAEFDGGKRWYVVGFIYPGETTLDFPEWDQEADD